MKSFSEFFDRQPLMTARGDGSGDDPPQTPATVRAPGSDSLARPLPWETLS
jgi:hypothetical protein